MPSPSLPAVGKGQQKTVMLQSRPISESPAPPANPLLLVPAPAPPLAHFEARHGRVGCTSLPDVKLFCDRQLYGATMEPAHMPQMERVGTRLQRLRNARPVGELRPMGVPTDDPTTQLQKIAQTRTKDDLIGISVEREALRRTPLERAGHVVRPGFKERGLKQQERLRLLRQEDERRRLAYRHEMAEATRRRMRQTREFHAQSTRRQPVQAMREEVQQTRLVSNVHAQYRRDVDEQVEALRMLGAFERAHRTRIVEEEDDDVR